MFRNRSIKYRILLFRFLLTLGKTINFYTKIIPRFLPIDFAISYIKQILVTCFITAGIINYYNIFYKKVNILT